MTSDQSTDARAGSCVPVADDLRLVAPAFTGWKPLLAAPVAGATWAGVSQTVVGAFVVGIAATVAVVLLSLGVTLVIVVVGIPILVLMLLAARPFARLERARLHAQLRVSIDAPTYKRPRKPGWWAAWMAVLGDSRSWAHVAYSLVGSIILATASVIVSVGLSGALALLAFGIAYGRSVNMPVPVPLLLAGAIVAAWLGALGVQASSLALVRSARSMLGSSPQAEAVEAARQARARADEAEGRAVHLTQTRTAAVGAADEERRRIERDLHDGAQQRLVALGVELGAAKRRASSDPDAAAALEYAHREVKETLAELRDLVRGIHPAVLTDRGLDAALSALAARSPVPVTVDVPGPLNRASTSAQAAAYFVVAEALTNVAKYAHATSVSVSATITPSQNLRLLIADDGRGGATPTPGSGLDGLRSRVAALDGTFDLDSPAGAGTRLTVEVPCAS
ncbi:sensor histidine kinase [Cellulomonas sp. URHE0023]|uniref:sensor histidine kinase n=1 Tax=Cellulomonas sp. URHE0023 TaxID=1380354 RepID=UPI0004827956|nr:sensor histidine kinase [Cellulomonas sp. URHE0023]